MALTKRAAAWLATLNREMPMPTAAVERLIIAAGGTPHAAWLEFHDDYAGYIEEVGPGEIAIWGLARSANASPPPMYMAHALVLKASGNAAKFYLEPKRLLQWNPFIKQLVLLELDVP